MICLDPKNQNFQFEELINVGVFLKVGLVSQLLLQLVTQTNNQKQKQKNPAFLFFRINLDK